MSKLRKHFITVLAVLFCALLALSTALIIPKNEKAVEATSVGTVLEIYDSNARKFSAKGLRTLYGNIYSSATNYNQLSEKLGNAKGTVLRTYSQITPTTIKLGEYEWNVVAASKNQKGEVIATLWLSKSFYTSLYAYSSFSNTTPSAYAPSEYGMSLIRSTLVGETYATGVNANNTLPGIQNTAWTTFISNYGSYIDTPYQVCEETGYQAIEKTSDSNVDRTQCLPNEAYLKYSDGNLWNGDGAKNVQECTNYEQWKDDQLWIPSLSETGFDATHTGLWNIKNNTVRANTAANVNTWLRSGGGTSAGNTYYLVVAGSSCNTANAWNNPYAVRPAFHLNLSQAAESAKGVSYDAVDPVNVDENSKTVTNNETAHIFTHTYDGKDVEIELLERAKLEDITSSDYTLGANYNVANGKFSARYPEQQPDAEGKSDKTYEISVQPKTNYVWDDNDKNEVRTYKVTISLAEMTVGWQGFNAKLGDNLLRPNSEIKVKGNSADSPLEVRYYIVEPNSTDTPPANTAEWTERGTVAEPTVEKAGTYTVHYEIKANYHKPVKSSYSVSVNVDNVIIASDGTSVGEAFYCTGGTESVSDWITKVKDAVTVTKNNQPYDSVDTLFGNLEVFLCDKNGNNYTEAVKKTAKNNQQYYDAGTYYLDLRFKDGANQSIKFAWKDNNRPTFIVKPLEITAKVVAANEGDKLTHVYGDSHAAMKIVLNDNTTALPDGGEVGDLEFGDYQLKKNDGSVVTLDGTTPVSKGVVIADVSNINNYDVDFETANSAYEVTKRTVKLVVADEEAPYGTDFTNYDFKSLTFADGESLVNNDKLANVITSITYSIESDAGSYDLDDILFIGEYDLNATATADNYIFDITGGKLTITQASFDLSGVKLKSAGYIYDGEPHPAQLSGDELPEEVSCTFRYVNYDTGEELDGVPTEVGLYLVYASFTHNSKNHKQITDVKAAYIRIAYTQEELNETYPPLPSDEDLAAAKDLAERKTEAKKKLDEEAKAKKDAIDSNADMTAEDKKAAKEEIEKELAAGNAAIDSAKDTDGVNKAYDDGKKTMEDTVELAETKTDAKKDLEKEAKDKKDAIDADVNLTPEEKKAAKEEIDKQLEEGKKEIDKSTKVNDVEAAESASKKDIEDYTEVVQKKGSAKSELDKAAQAKKDAIDANPELTDEEKAAAKAEVDKELEEGKKAVDGAADLSGVQSAESSTKTNIENVKVEHTVTLDEKKSSAKSELEKAASKKKAEIDDNDELTDEEKEEAKAKVDSELQKGLNAIESAEDDEELSKTVSDRKTKIENINPEHKGSFHWWIIAVAAGVLLLAAVVIIVIKKRQTADGDEDFYDEDYDFDEEDFEEDDFADEDF